MTDSGESIPYHVYHCLRKECGKWGVTARPPTFSAEIFGHLCPDCLGSLQDEEFVIYCTSCRAITGQLRIKGNLPPECHPKEPIVFVDGCPQCGKGMTKTVLRTTLCPKPLASVETND